MHTIFSRKGFDSQYGGVPSPILEGGRIAPLPIPSKHGRRLTGLRRGDIPLDRLVSDLSGGRHRPSDTFHVDPDLDADACTRRPGWRPAFGQIGTAQAHLDRQGVGVGDIFLFFGWYRQATRVRGRWTYAPAAPDIHSLFGWLQVGDVITVSADGKAEASMFPWLAAHPHVEHAPAFRGRRNTIFLAAERLHLSDRILDVPGAGIFDRWSPKLQLTSHGESRSNWRLPLWMEPGAPKGSALSYHQRSDRWRIEGADALLRSVAKGQEFVLKTGHTEEAAAWLQSLIEEHV